MTNNRWFPTFLLAASALLSAIGCTGTASTPTPAVQENTAGAPQGQYVSAPGGAPKRGGTLRAAFTSGEPPHYDITFIQVGDFLGWPYDTLMEFQAEYYNDSRLAPGIAEKWSVSPDGKTYTFSLRKGVKWQNLPPLNGREFTADDVAWNIDNFRTNSARKDAFEVVDSYQVKDRYTIEIRLKYPFAPFLNNLTQTRVRLVPKEVFQEDGNFRKRAVGTGPFILDKVEKGISYTLKRNPNYWKLGLDGEPLPYVSSLEAYFLDGTASVAALRAGRLDYISNIQAFKVVQALKKDLPELKTELGVPPGEYVLLFNHGVKPWDQLKVRQAACAALDQQVKVDLWHEGQSQWTGMIPSSLKDWAWSPEVAKEKYPLDLAKAKRLLQESGQVGAKATVQAYFNNETDIKGVQIVQQELNTAGFDVSIRPLPNLGAAQEALLKKDFQLALLGASRSDEPDDFLYRYWHSQGPRNYQNYTNPELDRLIDAERGATDPSKRKEIIGQVQELMLKDMVGCPLVHNPNYNFVGQPWVRNVKTIWWDLGNVTVKDWWLAR